MLLSSEIILKPGKSRVYFRLLTVIYLFTLLLLLYSSLHSAIKIVLVFFFSRQLWLESFERTPCPHLEELIYRNNQWIFVTKNDENENYDALKIIVQNPLFQLIQCSVSEKNKLIVLSNDQIPNQQLRLLNLLAVSK